MPKTLQNHIKERAAKGDTLEVVWVSCEGESPADIENIGVAAKAKYYSLNMEQGFLGRYFPYKNTEGYLQPLVAVQFEAVKRKCSIYLMIFNSNSFHIFQPVFWLTSNAKLGLRTSSMIVKTDAARYISS
jgi:hypothetical protein